MWRKDPGSRTVRPGMNNLRTVRTVSVVLAVLVVAGTAVAVLALTTFAGSGDNTVAPQAPRTRLIRATEVRSRVSTALSSLRSLSGEVTIECEIARPACSPPEGGGRTTRRLSFVTTAAGDERITGIGRQDDLAYSAAGRVQA